MDLSRSRDKPDARQDMADKVLKRECVVQTMTRSKRMQPVEHVAKGREQDAMYKLGQSQQYLDAQRAKLKELCAYRDQYANDFAASGENGFSATRVQDYRVFFRPSRRSRSPAGGVSRPVRSPARADPTAVGHQPQSQPGYRQSY